MKRVIVKFAIFLLLTSAWLRGYSQFDFPSIGGKETTLGGITTTLTGATSSLQNPAMLGFAEKSNIGIGILQNYVLKGFGHKNIHLTYASDNYRGNWGLDYQHFGNTNYSEQRASLGYGIAINDRISIGGALHYLYSGTSDAHYISLHLMTFSLGVQYIPVERMIVGVALINPMSVKMNTQETSFVPSQFKVGVGYQICEELTGHLELEHRTNSYQNLRIGLEYNYLLKLFARVGFCSSPSAFSFGIGYLGDSFAIDLGSQYHQQLGISPQISAHYYF